MNLEQSLKGKYSKPSKATMTVMDWLASVKNDPYMYASPAERLLKAIGEPEVIHTADDPKLSRIFSNKTIYRYKTFEDFYGMELVIERIVDYLRHSAQGLEEMKQILYLLGPVGSAKSTLAERLKQLMEKEPFWAIEGSPVHESPLGLFDAVDHGAWLSKEYNIPISKLRYKPSAWLIKRLEETDGDFSHLRVTKLYPNKNRQIAIAKTEAADENNQDVSALIGKFDIRKIEKFGQSDPDAYSYSGMLCLANRGLGEFVEMFKADIKMLNPLLTATQEGNYNGTETISATPFEGIILAHSNETEWQKFKNNKTNEALLDRVYLVKVPYSLRSHEEQKIYEKLIKNSELAKAPCAPMTLEMLADFTVLSRLDAGGEVDLVSKLKVYNGESLKDKDPQAKSFYQYRALAGQNEGMSGISTRFAFKVLSKVFNMEPDEIAANPVHLLDVLDEFIQKEQFPSALEEQYLASLENYLKPKLKEFIGREIQRAYLDAYNEWGQNAFDTYFLYADLWLQESEYKDPSTGLIYDRKKLDKELEKLEKPAQIANVKDFRNEVVSFCYRHRAKHNGDNPRWDSFAKIKEVIEKSMDSSAEQILPVITFSAKKTDEANKQHKKFIAKMETMGYTKRQIKILVNYYTIVSKL